MRYAASMPLSYGDWGRTPDRLTTTGHKRTQEPLNQQMEELTRFNHAAVGREVRMIERKREVNVLCNRLNQSPRYDTVDMENGDS